MNWFVTAGLGVVVLAAGTLLWARRRLVVVTVQGSSMEPTLLSGDRVLVHRSPVRVSRGQIVVLEPPMPDGLRWMNPGDGVLDNHLWNIKRVVALPGDLVPPDLTNVEGADWVPPGALVVFGDSMSSSDSRQRGFYRSTDLLGVVVRRMSTPTGRVPRQEV